MAVRGFTGQLLAIYRGANMKTKMPGISQVPGTVYRECTVDHNPNRHLQHFHEHYLNLYITRQSLHPLTYFILTDSATAENAGTHPFGESHCWVRFSTTVAPTSFCATAASSLHSASLFWSMNLFPLLTRSFSSSCRSNFTKNLAASLIMRKDAGWLLKSNVRIWYPFLSTWHSYFDIWFLIIVLPNNYTGKTTL